MRFHAVRGIERVSVAAHHGVRHGDEVQIVGVIHHGVNSLLVGGLEQSFIRGGGLFIHLCRLLMISGANISVCRHVD